MPVSILAISAGASAGALLRWQLNLLLNSLLPNLPLGTLCANWLGGWLMGLALGLFALFPNLGGEWRLMLVTGFLGALTTFSAFSAEMTALIQAGRLWLCTLGIALHVGGSIIMVFLGLWCFEAARRFLA